jgi:hypothetical protein
MAVAYRRGMATISLGALVKNAAAQMALQIDALRLATPHPGLKGDGAERIVQKFLTERLPTSLGVTTGHVVDSGGSLSNQADVIIFDALRTPVLFEAAHNGFDVVPVEGVVAVIEVKMHLTSAHLSGVLANAASVFALERTAYIGPPSPMYVLGGTTWSEVPVYYSLFAFESDNMYATELNALMKGLPPMERIASVCYADRGLNLHADMSTGTGTFSAWPTPLALFDIETPHSLVNWFGALSSVILQAGGRPLDLMKYAAADPTATALSGKLPESSLELVQKAGEQVLHRLGLDPEIAEAILNKSPLTEIQVAAIEAVGGSVTTMPDGSQSLSLPA